MDDVHRQLGVARRWLPLIVVVVALFGGLTFLVTSTQPRIYEASSRLIVRPGPNPAVGDLVVAEQLAAQYANLGRTRDLMDTVITELGLDESYQDFSKRISVAADLGSSVVVVSARSGDPDEAVVLVDAMAAELMARTTEAMDTESLQAVDEYVALIRADIARSQQRVDALLSLETLSIAQRAELTGLEDRLTALQQNYAGLIPLSSGYARNLLGVLEAPVSPTSPVEPRPLFWTMLALVAGLLLGAGIAFVLEYLNARVHDERELDQATTLPVLGAVVEFKGDVRGSPPGRLITARFPRSSAAENYRKIRSSLESSVGDLSSLQITSAFPREGKTSTAANLAVAYAEAGVGVLLIDADLRDPRVHTYFDLTNEQGLTTLLAYDVQSVVSVATTVRPRLAVLTSGPLPVNPADAIGSARFRTVLERSTSEADLVIVEGAALPAYSDALTIGGLVQATLLVVDQGSRIRDAREAAKSLLEAPRVNMAGAVLRRQIRGAHPRGGGAVVTPSSPAEVAPRPAATAAGGSIPPPTEKRPGPYAVEATSDSSDSA